METLTNSSTQSGILETIRIKVSQFVTTHPNVGLGVVISIILSISISAIVIILKRSQTPKTDMIAPGGVTGLEVVFNPSSS